MSTWGLVIIALAIYLGLLEIAAAIKNRAVTVNFTGPIKILTATKDEEL